MIKQKYQDKIICFWNV